MKPKVIVLVMLLGIARAAQPMLDLSLTYNQDEEASHRVKVLEKGSNRIYIGVEINQRCSSDRLGTHVEAPRALLDYGWGVDSIPLEALWRVPGVKMDASPFAHRNFEITADMLDQWERETSLEIPEGAIVLIYTGFKSEGKLSIDDDGNETLPQQPRLTADAASWLANYGQRHGHKGIHAVGIDLESLDGGDNNNTTSARKILYSQWIYGLHNLHNLEMLPQSGFLVTVMPMKIHKGEAAPARVFAEKEDTRPKNVDDDDEDDEDDDGDEKYDTWSSERDYRYPYPRWGHHDMEVMMSSADLKVAEPCFIYVVLPIMHLWLALRG